MRRQRNEKGAVIAFSTVLALILVMLGVAFVFLLMYMGGQHETKNAVDAGMLNVGKQSLDKVFITLDGSPGQQFFADVTNNVDNGLLINNDNNVDLRRINRVWAKALLVGINSDAAALDGQAGSGPSNAAQAASDAKAISDALSQKLTDANNLYGYFTDYAGANSVRMIGNSAQTTNLAGANWQTALMDRSPITATNRESNITVSGNAGNNYNMPPGYTLSSNFITSQTRNPPVASGNGLTFLQGYTPLTVAGNAIWQVPFQYDEKPRLVSRTMFDKSTVSAAPIAWTNAVPNAFSGQGQAVKTDAASETAVSWVLTNPRQSFQAALPQTFLKIHLNEMDSHWYFFPFGFPIELPGAQQAYGYDITPQSADEPVGGVGCSDVDADSVDLGSDVVARSLDDIIFSSPGDGMATKLEGEMVNRVNEMLTKVGTSVDASGLHSLLGQVWTRADLLGGGTGARDFYIYSADGATLTLVPDDAAIGPPWFLSKMGSAPDGTDGTILPDTEGPSAGEFVPIVTPLPDFVVVPVVGEMGWSIVHKQLNWQPGTGYNGCLGTVTVTRYTNVYAFGLAVTNVI